ncbi:MAG: GntR family transcriptional regulator [Anaerolineales bacterium]|nr:GntR family transcriptional regulator [Anaerolineales bacterium]
MVRRNISLARQAAQEILKGIESGKLVRANGALPSEAELSQKFDVSRATIRDALAQLEQRGAVTRRHGVGTFAAPPAPRIDTGLEELKSLETLARGIGLETRMSDPIIAERGATGAEVECLQISPNSSVISVARVILTGVRPIAYLVDVVPTTILQRQDLDKKFRGSVLDLFIQQRDLVLSHSRTEILIESADSTIARKLRLKRGAPLHKLQAQLFTRDGRIVDYSTSFFVPGYFSFHVIRRVGNGGQK